MILAGIDEAGYGPVLGPLVVGCCAMEIAGVDPAAQPPCLWQKLAKLVSKTRNRAGKKIHVNDSKDVYSPSAGLKELEKSLLSMAMTGGFAAQDFDGFIAAVAADAPGLLLAHPWYAKPANERFPFENESLGLMLFSKGLLAEMQRSGVAFLHLCGKVVPEARLNQLFAQTRNKASALFSIVAGHIDALLTKYADRPLVIFCDRQGGREHYGHLLRLMFEEWPLGIIREEEGHCEYTLAHPRGRGNGLPPVRLIFREKGERHAMPVALASMLAKYLRETLMHRFNAYWRTHLPAVQPTAGYYTDGHRFLKDIDLKRRELGILDDQLIRSR